MEAPDTDVSDSERPGFERLLQLLDAEYHFDFRQYKTASLARRIRTRMMQVRAESFDAYIQHLEQHAAEPAALFNAILINVTTFFRDPEAWELVRLEVIPRLLDAAAQTGSLRIWSAGCSTGEEPYTAAILLAEALGTQTRLDIKIYATDVDEDALHVARQALYRMDHLKDVPPPLLDRCFTPDGQLYRLRREIRRWCIFGRHNLVQDPPLSHVDWLICRNVLIYFKGQLQDRLLSRFHYAVREGGFLLLGKSEALSARARNFAALNTKWRLFQRVSEFQQQDMAAPARTTRDEPATERRRDANETEAGRVITDTLLNALPFPVMVIDQSDIVQRWNESAASVYGIPATNAIGRQFRDLDISYRAEGLRARIEDIKLTKMSARLEAVTLTRRGGDAVYLEFWMVPLLDERGRLSGILVGATDVTATVRLRAEMSRVAEEHATVTEELQSSNEELETTNEELQSTNEELETTNEELQSTNEELMTTVDELQAANIELAARGTELRRSSRYQQSIINSVSEPILVMDRAFTVTSWNEAAQRLWGVQAEDAVGRGFFSLPLGDVTHMARGAIGRLATGDGAPPIEIGFKATTAHDGGRMVLRLTPLTDSDGELQGVVATARTA